MLAWIGLGIPKPLATIGASAAILGVLVQLAQTEKEKESSKDAS